MRIRELAIPLVYISYTQFEKKNEMESSFYFPIFFISN